MTAAETLRASGFDGKVVIVSRETHLPYDRTKLSKVDAMMVLITF
jgi:NADPH-dependent 2,4-dienoyl-CoA reductase/sulfur reductase-like enzyme